MKSSSYHRKVLDWGDAVLGRSLWDRIPHNLRLGLVPILTTALLVQSGEQTATLLACISEGNLLCEKPTKLSVTDVRGLLILVNFVVVFWFAYRTLGEALAKSGPVGLDVKIIGLGTAFLSSLEIYGYALKNGVPERLVFALPVVFFVFIVPFVLLRKLQDGEVSDEARDATRHAFSALRQIVVALVVCAVSAIAGSVYFVLLNEGLHFGNVYLTSAIVTRDMWTFNPAILGLGWLPVLCMTLRSDESERDVLPLGMTAAGTLWLWLCPPLINAAIGVVLISDGSILGADVQAKTGSLWMVKALIGAGLTLAFTGAFFASWALGFNGRSGRVAGFAAFGITGALVGLAIAFLRASIGGAGDYQQSMLLHTFGFVIAFSAGAVALAWALSSFPDLSLDRVAVVDTAETSEG